jgi:hypothetical protein
LRQKASNVIGTLLRGAKQRAKKRGIEFSIAIGDMTVPEFCPCCGRRIVATDTLGLARHESPSLDRIDPDKGYVPGNVSIICWRCNHLKSDATAEELRTVADWIDRLALNVAGCGVRAPGSLS